MGTHARRILLVGLLALCPGAAGVDDKPRQKSDARYDSPDYWLGRAAAELPAVRAFTGELPKGYTNILSEEMLAVMMMQTRGSDADRQRLLKLARRLEALP